ncbi:MAG TPA: hypothetical protein VK742_02515 [Candidatus Sulfotelmatobacter sp.]|jgi:hypothetical protein|nr:hypothetical protein [Candidatus Sulfotelmatobacter sp.]
MKITKLILTAAAALGFCALQANATIVGVTTNYSKLNVSITVTTNKAEKTSGDIETTDTASAKLGNKQLLALFATYNGIDSPSTDPVWKNAMLVIGWDEPWDNDVLVVDKTGTNVLFDATTTEDSNFYFEVEFVSDGDYGVGSTVYKDASPGYWDGKNTDSAYYQLFVDEDPFSYIDIWGEGGSTQNFHQDWNAEIYTTWSDTESAIFPFQGSQDFEDYSASAKATITADGHGKGFNLVNWAIENW